MGKRIGVILLLLLLAAGLCACDTAKEAVQASAAPDTPTPEPTATPVPTPTPEPTPTPRIPRSNTSGKRLTEDEQPYQPTFISIENHRSARPQSGLMNADIVYEFLIEANYTRFIALFSDDRPCLAGPVRSTRYYLLDEVQEWDAMYGFQGYAQLSGKYRRKLRDYPNVVPGHTREFRRIHLGAKNVHSLYVYLADFITNNYGERSPERHDRFYFEEGIDYAGGVSVQRVSLPFTKQAVIDYEYDAAENVFRRYQDGAVFEARIPDAEKEPAEYEIVPVTVKNLIVQFCEYGKVPGENQPGEGKGRRSVELTGCGECAFFIRGKYVKGTWTRETLDDYTRYCLEDGTLVTLEPGNTWIEVLPDNAAWSFAPANAEGAFVSAGAPDTADAEDEPEED